MDRIGLINEITERFVLDLHGIHGIRHWARVRRHGLRLAAQTGANALLVELFASRTTAVESMDTSMPAMVIALLTMQLA